MGLDSENKAKCHIGHSSNPYYSRHTKMEEHIKPWMISNFMASALLPSIPRFTVFHIHTQTQTYTRSHAQVHTQTHPICTLPSFVSIPFRLHMTENCAFIGPWQASFCYGTATNKSILLEIFQCSLPKDFRKGSKQSKPSSSDTQ